MRHEREAALRGQGGQLQDIDAGRDSVRSHSTPIRAAGKVVGQVRGDVFYKSLRSTKHQLRRPPAWALDSQSLDHAEKAGARLVQIHDRDSGKTYTAAISLIRQEGFTVSLGYGTQLALDLALWTCQSSRVEQLTLWTAAPA